MKWLGFAFLACYIVGVGVSSFLQKFGMKYLSAYQINFLMALGMLLIALPALWLKQKSLALPISGLPLGITIGLLMAGGSFFYVLSLQKLPVGTAATLASSYIVPVILLSSIFLHESMSVLKLVGIAFTLIGVVILSLQ